MWRYVSLIVDGNDDDGDGCDDEGGDVNCGMR